MLIGKVRFKTDKNEFFEKLLFFLILPLDTWETALLYTFVLFILHLISYCSTFPFHCTETKQRYPCHLPWKYARICHSYIHTQAECQNDHSQKHADKTVKGCEGKLRRINSLYLWLIVRHLLPVHNIKHIESSLGFQMKAVQDAHVCEKTFDFKTLHSLMYFTPTHMNINTLYLL